MLFRDTRNSVFPFLVFSVLPLIISSFFPKKRVFRIFVFPCFLFLLSYFFLARKKCIYIKVIFIFSRSFIFLLFFFFLVFFFFFTILGKKFFSCYFLFLFLTSVLFPCFLFFLFPLYRNTGNMVSSFCLFS